MSSRSDPLGARNSRGGRQVVLLPWKYSRICTAKVEDEQAEGEEEETEAWCGRNHLCWGKERMDGRSGGGLLQLFEQPWRVNSKGEHEKE